MPVVGCSSPDTTTGAAARRFARDYLLERCDSSLFRGASGLARSKLEYDCAHPRSDAGTVAVLVDSLLDGNRQIFVFGMIESGASVFPGEPHRFEVVVETRTVRIVDYRFQ